jgi:predicted RND superfamily exporter protein
MNLRAGGRAPGGYALRRAVERSFAARETLSTTGQAMLFTSLVLSSGFFVYMFASMDDLFDFGLLSGFTILEASR